MVVRSSKNKCNIGISGVIIAEFRHILLICTENLCLKSISKNENIICILYKEKSYIIDLHLMKINQQDKIKKIGAIRDLTIFTSDIEVFFL